MTVLRRMAAGKRVDARSFRAAVSFFERTTGIPADNVDGTYLGLVPGREFIKDLQRWEKWFERCGRSLHWDETSGSIKVRADAATSCGPGSKAPE